MGQDKTVLNPGVGGDTMDEFSVNPGTGVQKRPVVVLGGTNPAGGDFVPTLQGNPVGDEYAQPVRPIASPTIEANVAPAPVTGEVQTLAAASCKALTLIFDVEAIGKIWIGGPNLTPGAPPTNGAPMYPGNERRLVVANADAINYIADASYISGNLYYILEQ